LHTGLLDHSAGAGEKSGWHRKHEQSGDLDVDREFKPGGRLHRQIAELGAAAKFALATIACRSATLHNLA
jgi:hypothetical protein